MLPYRLVGRSPFVKPGAVRVKGQSLAEWQRERETPIERLGEPERASEPPSLFDEDETR